MTLLSIDKIDREFELWIFAATVTIDANINVNDNWAISTAEHFDAHVNEPSRPHIRISIIHLGCLFPAQEMKRNEKNDKKW